MSYSTTFEKLEALRASMLEFVKTERRDYQPVFDVAVNGSLNDLFYLVEQVANDLRFLADFPDQEKMVLTADIKYKGNGRQGALKCMVPHVQSIRETDTSRYQRDGVTNGYVPLRLLLPR